MSDPRKVEYITDFDAEAAAFLQHYGYGNLVADPSPVPIREIAEKLMALTIVDTECLSANGNIQGIITFTDGIVDIFDLEQQKYIGFEATRGTVFVDAWLANEGRINNTLAHECFHWYKHRLYFRYKELHAADRKNWEFGFRCNMANESQVCLEPYTDEQQMEYQARTIAPKILMPRIATKKKLLELNQRYDGDISTIINALAEFFKVSKQSAAIRMTELGYSKAESYCNYIDGNNQDKRSLTKSRAIYRQQPISVIDAFDLYNTNELLRLTLDTGAFRYVDGHFVLNNPKYLQSDSLTPYAKSNLAECTLDFSMRLVRIDATETQCGALYHRDGEYRKALSFDRTAQNIDAYNSAKSIEHLVNGFEAQYERQLSLNSTTNIRMWEYMKAAKWNTSIFQDKTLLSPMDYTRIQKPDYIFRLPAYVAMAIGLGLSIVETEKALQLSGLAFDLNNREHNAYTFILSTLQGHSIYECNDFLSELGIKELGTQQRK